ncbi:MAG: hypothetical protein AAGE92_00010 [Cyanobacteria bacterium P01_G01_bin.4]
MSDTVQRGIEVQALVTSPHLQRAFDDVEKALLQKFMECQTNDTEAMSDIRKRLHLLDSVKANLNRAIQDGQLESFRIEEQKRSSLKEMFRRER